MADSYRSCIVTTDDSQDSGIFSTSGILIDTEKGLVLTHASLVSHIVSNAPTLMKDVIKHGVSYSDILTHCPLTVHTKIPTKLTREESHIQTALLSSHGGHLINNTEELQESNARVKCLFISWNLKKAISKMLPKNDWEFVENLHEEVNQTNVNSTSNSKSVAKNDDSAFHSLLPCFIVVQIQGWIPLSSVLSIHSSLNVGIGDALEVVGTPFGVQNADVFFNSHSRGIVSNVAGKHNCLILTDARCIPGCEGAAVYTYKGNKRSVSH